MGTQQELKVFGDKQIRTYWDDVQEKWFFCIADVVDAITDSRDVRQYIKRLRQRDSELCAVWGTICTPHQFRSTDGKLHSVHCSSREYKHLKGLTQENLRDNMTNEELVMNMLAELTATNITKEEHPESMSEHARVAERGGSVAKVAKEAFEKQTGKKVVSSMSRKRYLESQQPRLELDDSNPEE